MEMNSIQIPWEDWTIEKTLGSGGFGTVYQIKRLGATDERSAMKVIPIPRNESVIREHYAKGITRESIARRFEADKDGVENEYKLMAKLKGCANIVHCEDTKAVQHPDGLGWDVFIRMELLRPLVNELPERYDEDFVLKLGAGAARALAVCHENRIMHRDVKIENMFVSADGTIKLGDFGIAKVSEHTTAATQVGTIKFMAPEIFTGQHVYGTAADIYSLGLVLYWLMNERQFPFLPLPPELPTVQQEEEARRKRIRGDAFPPPENGSAELQNLVLHMCAFLPEDRPSADAVSEYLQNLIAKNRIQQQTIDIFPPVTEKTQPIYDPDETVLLRDEAAPVEAGTADAGSTTLLNSATTDAAGGRETFHTGSGTKPPAPKPKKWIWIGAAAAVAAGILIAVLLRGASGNRAAESAAQPTSEQTLLQAEDLNQTASSAYKVDFSDATMTHYFYDDAGRLSRHVRVYFSNRSQPELMVYVYQYDEQGRSYQIDRRKTGLTPENFAGGTTSSNAVLTMDQNDRRQSLEWLAGAGSYYEYQYDQNGNMLLKTEYSQKTSNEAVRETVYSYDENGNQIRETISSSKSVRDFQYSYDQNGNCIAVRQLDADGALKKEGQYTYLDSGLLESARYSYADGSGEEIRFLYDDAQNLVEIQIDAADASQTHTLTETRMTYNEQGVPVRAETTAGGDTIILEFDEYGNCTRSSKDVS